MPLSRLTNYVDGNVLTGAQLNNEFDNILNNGPSLINLSLPAVSAVQGLTGSIILNIGSFAAQGYQLISTSGITSLSATSSYSIDTRTAGPIANGRDQAAVFASTDVHFYAITTGGNSTRAAGICSSVAPPTGPTLPAGYTAWAYLASAKYAVATSVTTADATVRGNQLYGNSPATVLSSGGSVTGVDVLVDLTSHVPSIAPSYTVNVHSVGGMSRAAGGILDIDHYIRTSAGGSAAAVFKTLSGSSTNTAANQSVRAGSLTLTIPNVNTPPSCYYNQFVNTGTSAAISIRITGYSVPNADSA